MAITELDNWITGHGGLDHPDNADEFDVRHECVYCGHIFWVLVDADDNYIEANQCSRYGCDNEGIIKE